MKNSPYLDRPLRTFDVAIRDASRARERGIVKIVITRLENIQRDVDSLIMSLREELK